ncbi:MAG: IS30 family transposase [Clostridiales bacterium]|nr:IS30 family transposase [Clostridiales bacterium]
MRHFQQLTEAERGVIQKMVYSHLPKTEIARYIDRHHSTIYRELHRNKTKAYQFIEAHQKANARKRKKIRKLDSNAILRLIVVSLLMEKNSPELIAYYLKTNFPEDSSMQISHEAIYTWIYTQKEYNLPAYLFTKRKKRQNRSNTYKYRGVSIEKKNIRERPQEADEKSEPGHLEGDLIVSKGQDAYVLSLADRKNMTIWGSPVTSKDPEEVCRAVVESLEHLPEGFIKTITFDNGTEFNSYKIIEKALNCKVYFADPYCSWQRAINEHLNARIRQYLPKNKSFAGLTDDDYQDILEEINNRPRKSRNWRTPMSLLEDALFAFET